MSNIRNVQWNEGAPKELKAGMLLEYADGLVSLIGTNFEQSPDRSVFAVAKRWAWLIQPTNSPGSKTWQTSIKRGRGDERSRAIQTQGGRSD